VFESGDLRKGLKIELDGDPYVIVQFAFVKPGKGKAFYKCKLKNMLTGVQFNLEEHEMEYLYSDNNSYCFMNTSTYEQEFLSKEHVDELIQFLKENTVCNVLFFNGKPIGISLPNFVDLRIIKTDPWVKGDTAAGSTKPATLETGFLVQVPPFVDEGELVRIDTRTGQYVERVKE
jgi:elongation factor P